MDNSHDFSATFDITDHSLLETFSLFGSQDTTLSTLYFPITWLFIISLLCWPLFISLPLMLESLALKTCLFSLYSFLKWSPLVSSLYVCLYAYDSRIYISRPDLFHKGCLQNQNPHFHLSTCSSYNFQNLNKTATTTFHYGCHKELQSYLEFFSHPPSNQSANPVDSACKVHSQPDHIHFHCCYSSSDHHHLQPRLL